MKGLVIKNTGSWYQVKTDDGQSIECKIKGNFRLKGIRSTNPVAVGDRVQIILNQEGTAFISEIEDRKELHRSTFFQSFQTIPHPCRQSRSVYAGGNDQLSRNFHYFLLIDSSHPQRPIAFLSNWYLIR